MLNVLNTIRYYSRLQLETISATLITDSEYCKTPDSGKKVMFTNQYCPELHGSQVGNIFKQKLAAIGLGTTRQVIIVNEQGKPSPGQCFHEM